MSKVDENRLRQLVRNHLAQLTGLAPEEIRLDATLADYGLDSVDAVLLAGELEEMLEMEIDPASFLQYDTFELMIVGLSHDLDAQGAT
jgi:acyl carrier protein